MLSEISHQKRTNTIQFHSYVESNEQTELTRKMGQIHREQMTASGGDG